MVVVEVPVQVPVPMAASNAVAATPTGGAETASTGKSDFSWKQLSSQSSEEVSSTSPPSKEFVSRYLQVRSSVQFEIAKVEAKVEFDAGL